MKNMTASHAIMRYFKEARYDETKVNPAMCQTCGGVCCASLPCHVAPTDFKTVSKQIITDGIDEGLFCLDWYEGHADSDDDAENDGFKSFFVRIRGIASMAVDPTAGCTCKFLSENGCIFPFELRPKGARELIPAHGKCYSLYSKKQCAADWLPYNDMLTELYREYKYKNNVTENFYTMMDGLLECFMPLVNMGEDSDDT